MREPSGRKRREKTDDPWAKIRDGRKRRIVGGYADPSSAESPIGIMAARKIISADYERAAQIYEHLYRFRVGKVHAGTVYRTLLAMGVPDGPGWDWEDDMAGREERLTARSHAAVHALKFAGRGGIDVKNTVENAVCFRLFPAWLAAEIDGAPTAMMKERQLLLAGLKSLAHLFSSRSLLTANCRNQHFFQPPVLLCQGVIHGVIPEVPGCFRVCGSPSGGQGGPPGSIGGLPGVLHGVRSG